MANHITKVEREELVAGCRNSLENGSTEAEIIHNLIGTGYSRDRARSAVAKAQRLMRGEEVKQRQQVRLCVSLDDPDSLDHIAAIQAARPELRGASAVVREALRRMAAEL